LLYDSILGQREPFLVSFDLSLCPFFIEAECKIKKFLFSSPFRENPFKMMQAISMCRYRKE
jgi:hypothetical protein